MLSNLLGSLFYYLNHLELKDYLALVWFVLLSFSFLVLGLMLLRKHIILGFLVSITMIFILLGGPFVIKWYLNESLRKTESKVLLAKQLNFSNTFLIRVKVKNLSQQHLSKCRLYFTLYKDSENKYKLFFSKLKGIRNFNKLVEIHLPVGGEFEYKYALNNIRLQEDTKLDIVSECYK